MLKILFFSCFALLLTGIAEAQQCTNPGQTPVSATYICSDETFFIRTPTYCGQTNVPTPCTNGGVYQDRNPNFFRFACYAAGTLGLTIVPDEATANYDWQLFDVTNRNPVDIYTALNIFVACNWSADPGTTGASAAGLDVMVCSGTGQPLFSQMPDLNVGRTYLLMVSNQSGSLGGYQLTFQGGTAVISEPVDPHMLSAELNCDRTSITLRLTREVRCNSVTLSGSEFSLSGGATVVSAVPSQCNTQAGTGSFVIGLSQPLAFGNYSLTINPGNDGNTLTDNCNRSVPAGESIAFVSAPSPFTPIESVFNDECNPRFIELLFTKPMQCNSVAADGSDFIISGPQVITVTPALTTCPGNSRIIRLNLPSGILPGTYQLRLAAGSDGNTILNECNVQTPAGTTVSFTIKPGVLADFTQSNGSSCSQTTVAFFHDGANNVSSWDWDFGNGSVSAVANPVMSFATGNFNVRLIVSNGICKDTSTQVITISDAFNADFDVPGIICPGDKLQPINTSKGNIDSWSWNFGNAGTSSLKTPDPVIYMDTGSDIWHTIRLIVSNSLLGCSDTVTRVIKKLKNCFIAVPTAFSPNGDGKNDFLYPLNAVKADQLEFKVYNRYGQPVFITKDWTKKWDGRINGILQDTGVYAWLLTFIHRDSGERIFMKGTTLLIR